MQILDSIPFALDAASLTQRMCLTPGTEDARELEGMLDKATETAKPKAAFRECFIEQKGEDTVTIDGVTFTSRALRKNLDEAERVFPFVVTCGREMDRIVYEREDFLKSYWWEEIKSDLLKIASDHLTSVLTSKFALGKSAAMNPGSGDIDIWPIEQQQPLFSLLGDVDDAIGVELSDSFLMSPIKSLSGIRFPTEVDFRTCQLCRRNNCPSRSAPFDKALWKSCRS
ncbi:MAG: hypothetical protein K9L59_16945 [Desulfobacterales bacterium]|nr:hypothetical protein [Desulfobacterales bacterium]